MITCYKMNQLRMMYLKAMNIKYSRILLFQLYLLYIFVDFRITFNCDILYYLYFYYTFSFIEMNKHRSGYMPFPALIFMKGLIYTIKGRKSLYGAFIAFYTYQKFFRLLQILADQCYFQVFLLCLDQKVY